eukprot:2331607-Amphidinium_carterae.1
MATPNLSPKQSSSMRTRQQKRNQEETEGIAMFHAKLQCTGHEETCRVRVPSVQTRDTDRM